MFLTPGLGSVWFDSVRFVGLSTVWLSSVGLDDRCCIDMAAPHDSRISRHDKKDWYDKHERHARRGDITHKNERKIRMIKCPCSPLPTPPHPQLTNQSTTTNQVPFIPHPEGAETAASRLVGVAMKPLFDIQEAWEARKQKNQADDASNCASHRKHD